MPSVRDRLVRQFQAGQKRKPPGPPQFPSPHAQATTRPGKLSGGTKITEDDPRWRAKRKRKLDKTPIWAGGPRNV
jgi:hypothetical protein